MIIGERKPFDETKENIKDYKKILVLGCGTCVSVCMAGGEKEVELLASQLRIAGGLEGKEVEISEATVQRQCDREYIEPIIDMAKGCDAVVSMACGAGVQMMAEMVVTLPVVPAINTCFIGVTEAEGAWSERCRACGDCKLGSYGGICPVTICAKGLLNGPCGGASLGKCEAGNNKDCAWELIYQRLKQYRQLDNLNTFVMPLDHMLQAHPVSLMKEC
ncbi:methylenetetrahydrofolate reductase C-terminal domain-containing protein [Chloroflexota bacterium]